MTAKRQNFDMQSGDDKVLTVTVTNDAGTAIPLTGAQAIEWRLADSVDSTTAHVTKTLGSGIAIVSSPNDHKFTVTLVPADTDALAGNYYHEAQVKDAAGKIATVMTGKANIRKDLIP